MVRPSNRSSIVEAAIRVAEAQGITAVTIDSVAAEAGLTKGGLLYHFPNRSALLVGVHAHLAESWEREMIAALGKQPEEASDEEKVAAYVRVAARPATRAEVLYIAEAGPDPELFAPWARIAERWSPAVPAPARSGRYPEGPLRALLARIAADGLWGYETFSGVELPEALRREIAERILEILSPPDH
ncbi:TetR/AcrR family transcriptional regulator [Microbacterium sp. NPDC077663]|uniref:TetR/AcrR family transcriptional regulator n=1 Tax=Microbacterium sp. NPDC077663 TaxID=3364189 RepID=UPI0037C83AE2